MIEQTALPPQPQQAESKQKKPRKAKATTPRKPRVVDPVLAAIAAEAKEKRKTHKAALASGKVYTRIVKWCEKLTNLDKQKLVDSFAEIGRE